MYNYDINKINEALQSFEKKLLRDGVITKLNYITLYRHILEAEQKPKDEIIALAKRIKPLVRLDKCGIRRSCGEFADDDQLVFINPSDIKQSYLYSFSETDVVTVKGDEDVEDAPFSVPKLREITSFTCYHKYGGYYGFFRPGVDEVLAQIPPSVDIEQISAFELKVKSFDFNDIYDPVLDRHVTTVILYAMEGGLPETIKNQSVIYEGETY